MKIDVQYLSKKKLTDPVLIEGLPGIGNVGKIAIDFLVENINAKEYIKIYSHHFPHSVFVNEKNLIDLPVITIYHKNIKNREKKEFRRFIHIKMVDTVTTNVNQVGVKG